MHERAYIWTNNKDDKSLEHMASWQVKLRHTGVTRDGDCGRWWCCVEKGASTTGSQFKGQQHRLSEVAIAMGSWIAVALPNSAGLQAGSRTPLLSRALTHRTGILQSICGLAQQSLARVLTSIAPGRPLQVGAIVVLEMQKMQQVASSFAASGHACRAWLKIECCGWWAA